MSASVALVLESDALHVVPVRGAVRTSPWTPTDADALARALRTLPAPPAHVVLVVGVSLCEWAEPVMPPVSPSMQRAMLWHDADRTFAIDGAAAVVTFGSWAMAVASDQLTSWVRAAEQVAPVQAVVPGPAAATAGRPPKPTPDAAPWDPVAAGRAALQWSDAPLDAQLLDPALHARFRQTRVRRWRASVFVMGAACVALGWALWTRGETARRDLERTVARLEQTAAPARRAAERLNRADDEVRILEADRAASTGSDAPLRVLAVLTQRLPRDVVLQRVQFDSAGWRIDGTARQAPPLVPLLDAVPTFTAVRIAAPGTRFLDTGRPRESFALSFHTQADRGGPAHDD